MMRSARLALQIILVASAAAGSAALAQMLMPVASSEQTREALAQARIAGNEARKRAERLEAEAQRVTLKADKTAREAAAIAARIQETEAEIAASQVQVDQIAAQLAQMRAALAEKQEPLVRLTAALQRLSRRPPVLGLLRPGSMRETVYLRAMFDTMLPQVEERTAALRMEIEKGRQLERQQALAFANLKSGEAELRQRQQRLAGIETRQRLASREVAGIAARERDKSLALAEKARDLGDLVKVMGKQGELRAQLAALPGPVMRPARPEDSLVEDAGSIVATPRGPKTYILPVTGKVASGFGEAAEGRQPSRGIQLAVRGGAQAVAPAAGRVAYAGPYRGYGKIVILEHDGGLTSLVTGLARLDVEVGDALVAGSPLGITPPGNPVVTLELRRDGVPVNPLQFLRTL